MKQSYKELIQALCDLHRKIHKAEPNVISFAPGRVEVLGNHTDYNEGFVLSSAIEQGVAISITEAKDAIFSIYAPDIKDEVLQIKLPITQPISAADNFANYVLGVIYHLSQNGISIPPLRITIKGNLPAGAGLSSSAALECATALAVLKIAGKDLPLLEIAKVCQKAEHTFVGAKCGLLDQLSSLYGRKGKLMFIDFRSLAVEHVPFPEGVSLLLANSNIKHSLVESEYNTRRASCEQAVIMLSEKLSRKIKALRDVTLKEFNDMEHTLPANVGKRARHVIEENERVIKACKMLKTGDLNGFGKLMFASHMSSKKNFENSAPELDFLVEQAKNISSVFGARLSGGGFGGAIIIFAKQEFLLEISSAIEKSYFARYGRQADTYIVSPSDGAHIVDKNNIK